MIHSMFRALVDHGHQVTVWLSKDGPLRAEYGLDGVRVIPFQSGVDFATQASRADVLVSHLENVAATAGYGRRYRVPVVSVCHNTFDPTFGDIATGAVPFAVYNSLWMQDAARVWFARAGVEAPESIVVRPPVYAADYRTDPGDAITLVNLNQEKGGDLFWRIAERMPERRFLGVLGAYGTQVRPPRRLANLEIIPHVPGDRMRDRVYARTAVLLVPSEYESWGRVGVEAMASGIPVIAHPTPGLVESLGAAGIFASRDDLDAYVTALRDVLEPAAYELASARARRRSAELDPAPDLAHWVAAVEEWAARNRTSR
ncbi:glycosyltransferase family 4 protein [Allostreptomyces psammosilenae]|uniref:Glycosyltransferase involved in cell wall biosynthesis n=1 Tax=Allostreptomyces psammosilenae TaxID=1892865 RepID=A0A852ZQA5_9ACTN|nr:glycosyltransferase family 4 protein [Allostreptomyces psammosilenae]NYI04559.1 glycosyltransferase involved in cell wall biosynthesis [Allostreptomyces psammosilenae]